MDCWCNTSCARESTLSRGELHRSPEKGVPSASAFPKPPATIQDEGAAFVASLRACSKYRDLYRGTQLHDAILRKGLLEQCSDSLVTMYAKCGELAQAKVLLDMHKSRDVVAWTALIGGYVRERQAQNALDCLECMLCEDISPNAFTYSCILKACGTLGALEKGQEIHRVISRQGLLQNNIVLGTSLMDMYVKCRNLLKARLVLEELPSRDVVSWSALIAGYAQEGQAEEALNCFECMRSEGIPPNDFTYACILKACATIRAVDKGKEIHDEIASQGLLQNNLVLGTALVDMYAKCGALSKAQNVIEELSFRDVVTWSALISGYAQAGQGEQAMKCFERMQHDGILPDAVTYASILKACAIIKDADSGKEIHEKIARQGMLQNNIVLGTALVDMYAKCGAFLKARDVLEKLPSRDVILWNALIGGYAQEGEGEQALDCFECMLHDGVRPNAVSYACILKACSSLGAVDKGKEIHDEIVKQGLLQDNIVLGTALVDMYAKCGAFPKAQEVLETLSSRGVATWNALITGYAQKGQGEQALSCFQGMQHEGISPDAVTYVCILKACATIGAVDKGKRFHDEIVRHGFLRKSNVLGAALVDMYSKCGALSQARRALEELPSRDVFSWSALIAGYAQAGQAEEVLTCFKCMKLEGILPNAEIYACTLKSCAILGAIDKGKEIHDEIEEQGLLQNNIVLGTALVDLYVKCGALPKAQIVLEELSFRDAVSWNALIGGYAQEGQGEQVLKCFDRMQSEGILPTVVTFVCVLNACSHLGLVDEGHALFTNMNTKYGVKPNLESYACMVGLFGRSGHLERAVHLVQEMPSSDNSALWLALLGACQKWGDVKVGTLAFEEVLKLDISCGPAYVLMANTYMAAGMQENAKSIEAMRIKYKASKGS